MRQGWVLKQGLMAGLLALLVFAPGPNLPGTAKLGLGGPAMAQGVLTIDQFYDALAPYGEWVQHPAYGYVWLPLSVQPNWRPYTVGRWIDTEEYGWYWDSPEPFAWAVYHYGRWGYDPEYGWFWVPGDTWAPAWVQWRYGTDYVGWAPVVPDSYRGYAYGGPAAYAPPPPMDSWVFVRPRYLAAPRIAPYVVPSNQIFIAFNLAPNVYRPAYRNGYIYNYGMPRDRWAYLTHQRIQPRRIYRGNDRYRPHDWARRHNNRDLYVYAPGVRKGVIPQHPPKKVSKKPSRVKGNNTAKVQPIMPAYPGSKTGAINPNLRNLPPNAKPSNNGAINPNLRRAPEKVGKKPSKAKGNNTAKVQPIMPAYPGSKTGAVNPNLRNAPEKVGKKPSKAKGKSAPEAQRTVPAYAGHNPGVINPNLRHPPEKVGKKPPKAKANNAAKVKRTMPAYARGNPGVINPNLRNPKPAAKNNGAKSKAAKSCKTNPNLPSCHKRGG